ncbi:MAG: DUF5667 domain-containing protein [Methanocellales archaeon]|nr:DUF5667 domain-containing protein [Methanocellales archaeon]
MRIVPIALIAVLILAAQPAAAADGPKWADPESPLYGLKIALENANEAFSFGKEARLEKQLAHAESRLAEAQAMADQNRTRAMERAIERYEVKLGQINETVFKGNVNKQYTERAMNMTQKHQRVLSDLLERIDNGTMPEQARKGIERALNNSIQHQEQGDQNRTSQINETVGNGGKQYMGHAVNMAPNMAQNRTQNMTPNMAQNRTQNIDNGTMSNRSEKASNERAKQ